MSLRLKIAFRNVMRNRRRTILSVLIIAGGIAAMVVFRGITHSHVNKMESIAINTQFGHIQVASDKTWKPSADDKARDRAIKLDDSVVQQIEKLKSVDYTAKRLTYFGLVSFEDRSISARGVGFEPTRETKLNENLKIQQGRGLSGEGKFEVILGSGLAEQLNAKVGGQMALVGYTFDGSVNAIDAEVVGIFQTGLNEVDNSTFYAPVQIVQRLLDTENYETLVVQLKEKTEVNATIESLQSILPAGVSPKPWSELAVSYRKMVEFTDIEHAVVNWIIVLLALLAIANTVGMSVSERTGEIGTARAMGNTRLDIMAQFILEGCVLSAIGGVIGCVLGLVSGTIVTALKIYVVIPGASTPHQIVVDFLLSAYQEAILLTCVIAVLATIVPAFRASRIPIVAALRHNI